MFLVKFTVRWHDLSIKISLRILTHDSYINYSLKCRAPYLGPVPHGPSRWTRFPKTRSYDIRLLFDLCTILFFQCHLFIISRTSYTEH